MKQKAICTAVLLLIGVISFGPVSSIQKPDLTGDTGLQKPLTEKINTLLRVWTVLKVINGVINVLQSAQIGGGFFVEASVNPLEILAPLDHILDRLSDLLLWSLGALMLEKLLLAMTWLFIFKVIIPVGMILCSITIWVKKAEMHLDRIIIAFSIVGLASASAAPLSLQVSAAVEKSVFTDRTGSLLASITDKGKNAEAMEQDVAGLKKIGASILSFMRDAKTLCDALIEDTLHLLIIFFAVNIGIPLLTVFGIISAAKYTIALLLSTPSSLKAGA